MFYITTPIYYVNDEPHLGHAYTTILADALARYHRLQGEEVFFLTGVDEHGQKVLNAVKKLGNNNPTRAELQAYVDEMAARFQATWRRLHIQNDAFFRTTAPHHAKVVQGVLQKLWDEGKIYRGEYEGWYCVPDERFWTEKDLVYAEDGAPLCPDCRRPVERIVESNYFFRMSQYQDWLVEYIQANPDFIRPAFRRNEVLGFLRRPLGDLCISRPAARLSWGIPLPFDPDYVTYVWFDALLNYVTAAGAASRVLAPLDAAGAAGRVLAPLDAAGYAQDEALEAQRFDRQWPCALHLMAKDILTTHSVYWPTMLRAAGLPLPRGLFAHGYWTISGTKMGKSLGNAVRPLDLADIYGVDAFRYFLMRDMTPGLDADFDPERVAARYSADLANNLGNLLQRVTSMAARYCGGEAPEQVETCVTAEEAALRARVEALPEQVFAQVEQFSISAALGLVMDALAAVNGYLERTAPWLRAKEGDSARVGTILYTAGEALRFCSVLLAPVLPERMEELWRRLGWQPPEKLSDGLAWGAWQPGSVVVTGEALFPRKEG
jgi:methionyl-tRNA synthetase